MNHTLRNWLLVALALVLLLVSAYQWALSRDRRAEKITLPLPHQVAEQENAFTQLAALGQQFGDELEQDSTRSARFYRHAQREEWDADFVAELLQNQDSLYVAMDQICELPHCQAPAMSGPQDKRPDLMPLVRLVRLRMLAMQHAVRQQDGDTAMGHIKASLRLANMVENDANGFLPLLLGMIMYAIVEKQMGDLLSADLLDADQLLELQKVLQQGANAEALQNALWGECRYMLGSQELVLDVMEGRITPEEAWPGIDSSALDVTDNWFSKALTRWSYMPNLSRLLVHDSFAQLVKRCGQPVSEWEQTRHFEEPGLLGVILLPNGVGRNMAYNDPKRLLPLLSMKAERVSRDGHGLALATRRYELEHGSFPQKLADLLPDYINALPLDPFDGEALRYLPEMKLVYSVGRDCIDQGGSSEVHEDPLFSGSASFRMNELDLVYSLDVIHGE